MSLYEHGCASHDQRCIDAAKRAMAEAPARWHELARQARVDPEARGRLFEALDTPVLALRGGDPGRRTVPPVH